MNNEFFYLLRDALSTIHYEDSCYDTNYIDNNEYSTVYNKILDKLVHNIFFEIVDNELLLNAFVKLPRLERIIVVFYVMLGYTASDVADIANTSIDSVHTQRYKAIQRLRSALGIKK